MNFKDFIANNRIKEQLSVLKEADRLPHAIILEGDEGLGKKTLAKEIALNLFCRGKGDTPCRECPQCSKVIKNIHPDIYEYSAPATPRSFSIKTVREIREDVYVSPNEANYKIYILGNCQCMTVEAQNALLKVLEEPPAYAIFILTVTTKSAMLETVLSRCVVFSVEGVDAKQGADYICEKDDSVDYNDAYNAMSVWNGNIGKAIQSLSDGKLSKISTVSNDICRALLSENEYDLLIACSVFSNDRATMLNALNLLKTIFRDAMLYGSTEILSGNEQVARQLSLRLNKVKLLKLIEASDNIREMAENYGNNAILITKICYELRRAIGR